MVFLVAVVNAYEIWIAVRYSKLLVVAWCLLTTGPAPPRRHWLPWPAIAMLIATLMASNLAYGYYLAHYFHEAGGH